MYQKLREMIKSGELGHIKRISWIVTDWYRPNAYHKSATWRSTWDKEGGGTLVNQNPHQLDLWQWMFGMPDTIYADCSFGKYRDIEVDDEVTAYIKYKNGTTGTYITSIAEAPGTNRLEIACDAGKIVIESGKMIFKKLKQSEPEFDKVNEAPFGCPGYEDVLMDVSGNGLQHVGILNDYAEAVLNGTPLLAPGEEGINGVTLASAMYLSTWRGLETIDLNNFPHEEFYERLMEKAKNAAEKKGVKSQTVDINGTY
jgi:predicted dehydrogenase